MCVTRAGRVVSVSGDRGRVEFFDGRALDGVDLSVVKAGVGDYLEVFGNLAMSTLTPGQARSRRRAWAEVAKAVALEAGGLAQ